MPSPSYHPIQGSVHTENGYLRLTPPDPISGIVQSFWQLNVPEGRFVYHSIPDNCVDWITRVDKPEDSVFIPPFLSANPFEVQGPVSFFGVRFNVLGYQAVVRDPLENWLAEPQGVLASEFLSSSELPWFQQAVFDSPDFCTRCSTIVQWFIRHANSINTDARLDAFLKYSLLHLDDGLDMSERHCQNMGISSRQLRRIVRQHLGVSPREFHQVLRFQNALSLLNQYPDDKGWANYYYDQSHFIRDCQRFIGMPYQQFKNMSVLYNADDVK